tara:strand:- start:120 stop:389 length:270 start_codon:yes stop_codon:yes gene_type:complete
MINAGKALAFNVHVDRVSTTMAHGSIKIGVSNLIITAFGLDNFKVAWLNSPTIASVTTPISAPAAIIFQSKSEVIDEAKAVIAPHRIRE